MGTVQRPGYGKNTVLTDESDNLHGQGGERHQVNRAQGPQEQATGPLNRRSLSKQSLLEAGFRMLVSGPSEAAVCFQVLPFADS